MPMTAPNAALLQYEAGEAVDTGTWLEIQSALLQPALLNVAGGLFCPVGAGSSIFPEPPGPEFRKLLRVAIGAKALAQTTPAQPPEEGRGSLNRNKKRSC